MDNLADIDNLADHNLVKHPYLNACATTPMLESVLQVYTKAIRESWHNTAGLSSNSIDAACQMQDIKELFLDLFDANYIYFTSSCTAGNNIVIQSFSKASDRQVITGAAEHKSVLEPAFLDTDSLILPPSAKAQTYVGYAESGSMQEQAVLISCMAINNETGQDNRQLILAISDLIQQSPYKDNIYFHIDFTQAAAKCEEFDLLSLAIDYLTFSSHKFHGPAGVGALIVRDDRALAALSPLLLGGKQQDIVSGTVNLPGILGMWDAYQTVAANRQIFWSGWISQWRAVVLDHLRNEYSDQLVINSPDDGVPWILNISIMGFDADDIVWESNMDMSTGAACSHTTPSHVLTSLGYSQERIQGSIRLSISPLMYQNIDLLDLLYYIGSDIASWSNYAGVQDNESKD